MDNLSTVLHYYPVHPQTTPTHGFYPVGRKYPDEEHFDYQAPVPYYTQVEDEDDIKRPMNSFLLWAKIMRRKYANENPNLHNAEISKLLGRIWNAMTTLEKRPFVERAEKLRIIHMRTYPNYRYAPKKRKDKKSHRTISPEIAAALHSTLFDVKNIISGQLSQKNSIGNLKSYGYLRKAFENNQTSEKVEDNKEHTINNQMISNENHELSESEINEDLNEVSNVQSMTLHYYPTKEIIKNNGKENQPKCNSDISINEKAIHVLQTENEGISNVLQLDQESTEQSKIERIAQWCADIAKSNGNETNRLSHAPVDCIRVNSWNAQIPLAIEETSQNIENIELRYSTDDLYNDLQNSSIDNSIEVDLPDFLQTLINSPLHFNNSTTTDSLSLWSDIGDIISAGTIR